MSKVKNSRSKTKQDAEIEIIDMGSEEKSKKASPLKNEIIGLIIIAFSILSLIFMMSDKVGGMGHIIKTFFQGLLGIGAYLMPFLLFTYGVVVIRNKAYKISKKRMFWFAMVIISFVSLDHLFYENFSGDTAWKYDLRRIYDHALKGDGGGLIGGIIAITLYKLFYIYGAVIVAITFFTIATMLAADVSILLGFGRIVKFFMNKRRKKKESYADTNYEEQIEQDKDKKKNPVIDLNSHISKSKGVIDLNDQKNDSKDDMPDLDDDKAELAEIKIIDRSLDEKINIINHISEDGLNDTEKEDSHRQKPVSKDAGQGSLEMAMNADMNETKSKKSKKSKEPIGNLDINYSSQNADASAKKYVLPDIGMLNASQRSNDANENKELLQNAKKLEETLESFGVKAKVLRVSKGPTVTRYELQPDHGVKVSRIVNLADDIALNLAAPTVRIEAPIPGKSAVGIEIPNKEVQGVFLRDVVQTKEFLNSTSKLTFAVGMDVEGNPIISDIAKMPHMLIAGSTGSGKSVCVNTLIASVLYKASPDEVKIIMIDPKVVELNVYNGIPHLMIPVVTDPKKAAAALNWGVQEMLHRYNLFAESGTRDIRGYNSYIRDKAKLEGEETEVTELPQILIIIDELADLMMAAANEVEDAICRLAQMARAAGMHLVIATQRPSVDVITGVIKANIPSRIAFAVSSQVDSRTIIDMAGAEKLLGKGDMLFYPLGRSKPVRVQGPFISDKEVEKLVEFVKSQNSQVEYDEHVMDNIANMAVNNAAAAGGDADELLPQAIDIIMETQFASISMLQRRMRIGFSRAARLIDQMEARDIVGPAEGSKPRKVLMSKQDYEQMKMAEE